MPKEYSSRVCLLPLRDSERATCTQSIPFADTAKVTGLQINEIYVHARTVDTRPSFPPP